MAVRPIDGNELIKNLKDKRLHILIENENDGAAVFDDIIDWIKYAPTLIPPNEPLTLEHLRASPHGKIKDSTLQSICNRTNEIACRPPEGEANE